MQQAKPKDLTSQELDRARDQHDPHAFHRRSPAGEVRPSRHADGSRAAGLRDLEPRSCASIRRTRSGQIAIDFVLSNGHASMLLWSVLVPDRHARGKRATTSDWASRRSRSTTFAISASSGAKRRGIPSIIWCRALKRRQVHSVKASPPASAWRSRGNGLPAVTTSPASTSSTTTSMRFAATAPDGRRRLGGGFACRPSRSRRSVLDLRQQSHHHRRQDSHHFHRGCRRPLPRLSIGTCCGSAMPTISRASRKHSRSSVRRKTGRR